MSRYVERDNEGMSQAQGQSSTSKESAEWISGKSGKLRAEVLKSFRYAGARGLTDEEGIYASDLPANTYRPRRVELTNGWKDFEGGFIRDSGRKRKTASGRNAVVWVITPKGLMA
jgi:hypothetical protein